MSQRTFVISTAAYWFEEARAAQKAGAMSNALLCMENAFNHTENALASLVKAAEQMPRQTPRPGAASTVHDFKIEASCVWDLDRVLTIIEAKKPVVSSSTPQEKP